MGKAAPRYELLTTTEGAHGAARDQPDYPAPWWINIWRSVNLIMTVFFFLAALVQVNDPDPYLWVPVYAFPGLLTLSVTIQPGVTMRACWRHLVVAHMALCLAASLYLVVVLVELLGQDPVNPLVHEEGRELGGLLIIIIWLAISRFTKLGNPDPTKDSISALLLVTGVLALLPLAFWGLCFVDQLTHKLGHCNDMFKGGLFSREPS